MLPGDTIEYLDKGLASSFHRIEKLQNESGDSLLKANPGTMARLRCDPPGDHWEAGALLRKEI